MQKLPERLPLPASAIKSSVALLVLLLCQMSAVSAQTLDGALQLASEHNPRLTAERARLAAAEAKLDEARAGWLPSVHVEGSAGSEKIDTDLSSEFGGSNVSRTLHPRTVGLVVEQSIYDGGKTSASTSRDEQALSAQQARLSGTEQEVFLAAATAYLDVRLKQSVMELEQHNVETLQQQLSATRLRHRAGELTPTDVYQAQARLAQAKARLRRAEAQRVAARAAYVRSIGTEPESLSPPEAVTDLPQSLDEALQQAQQNQPQLIQARYALAAARENIDAVRAGGRPTFKLVGAVQRSENDAIFTDRTDTQRIMLNARIPLYAGGANSARVRQAEQLVAQRQSEVDSVRDAMTQKVTSAWEAWQAAKAELRALREQRRASKAAFDGVRAEQRAGSRTVLDVLNAQQELLNAQVGVASAERDLLVTAYQLRATVGILTSASLGLAERTKVQ